ncbi:MAG: patatin-like phospholipase family protein [Bacteroidota bacterium]
MNALEQRLFADGPKRILSLDGGGIRGAITLGYLLEIETRLRKRYNQPDLVLRDYFDLIGGTSTGSIIAASLAIGMSVADIRDGYLDMGGHIFESPAAWWQVRKLFRQNLLYRNKPSRIEGTLQEFYGDTTLADERITTGLVIVTKRADRASTWPFHNNPRGRYYETNGPIPLHRLVRASSAAPTYFPPRILDYGNGKGAFIDGGVSMHNNPSALLFLMATVKGYRFEWPAGDDRLMLVSIGTGTSEKRQDLEGIFGLGKKNALFWGKAVPDLFIRDTGEFSETIMQLLSQSPTARRLDRQIGDLQEDNVLGRQLHYVRYNALIDDAVVERHRSYTRENPAHFPPIPDVKKMMAMDKGNHVYHLARVGELDAKEKITDANFDVHFPGRFDVG